jgi:ribosomal protein L29
MTLTPHTADVLNDLVILDAHELADLRTAVLEDQLAELRAELAERRMLLELAELRAEHNAREARRHRRSAAELEQALERSQGGPSWWQRMLEVLSPVSPEPR